jgi:hypothetical protein
MLIGTSEAVVPSRAIVVFPSAKALRVRRTLASQIAIAAMIC